MRRHRRATAVLVLTAVTAVAGVWAVPAPASAAVNTTDTEFLTTSHRNHLAEIAAGKSAQDHGSSIAIRRMGGVLVTNHTQLDEKVTAAATTLSVTLPTEPSAGQQQRLADVEANTGKAYDSAWTAAEISSHRAMISQNDKELRDGQDPTVLGLAQDTGPVIVGHLHDLQDGAGTLRRVDAGTGGQASGASWMPLWFGAAGVVLLAAATAVTVAGRLRRTPA